MASPALRNIGLLMLTLVSAALPLLVFEALLAVFWEGAPTGESWKTRGYHAPDPELIYFTRPNAHNVWLGPGFVEVVDTNGLGLRDAEIEERSRFERRIVVLGDSMTFGHGVKGAEAYPNALEALFRAEGRGIDVINAGIKGYGIDQAYRLFELRLRGLEPDLVILAYYENDLHDGIRHPLYRLEHGRLVALDATEDPLYRIGRLNELTPAFLRSTRTARWLTTRFVAVTARAQEDDLTPVQRLRREGLKIATLVDALVARGRKDGFEVLVLAIPVRNASVAALNHYRWLAPALEGRARLLDLSPEPAWRNQTEPLFFRHDFHLNALGHQRVAEAIRAELRDADF